MIQTLALGVAVGYGVLALAGGTMGYVKAKSRASLIAGGVSGALLIGGAVLAATHPVAGFALVSVVSLGLVARFARKAFGAGRSPIALVMLGGGVAVLMAAGLALA